MVMWIERIEPRLVADKSTLPGCLRAEGTRRGLSEFECSALLASVPPKLPSCECFLDALTGIWRYEFGQPHEVAGELVWGTHMWAPVPVLFDVLACARLRLPPAKHAAYLALLGGDERKHQDYLAEMFPMLRVEPSIAAEYEAAWRGAGNRTLDWAIGPAGGRLVLLDVKRRYADFVAQMKNAPAAGSMPAPEHDVALLFRSVESKLLSSNPDEVLQGVFIATDIKQEATELAAAFKSLDSAKVHFAILGDAAPDICLLTRRPEDRPFLLNLCHATEGTRFAFDRTA